MDAGTKFEWETHQGKCIGGHGQFGCTATLIGSYVWLVGGVGADTEIFVLNLNSKKWEHIQFEEFEFFKFVLHTTSLCEDKLLLFGLQRGSGIGLANCNELVAFDPVLKELQIMPTYGRSRPRYRHGHSADVCERLRLLALFGGYAGTMKSQLWVLDLTTWQWTLLDCKGQVPSPRSKHASSVVGSILFVYHGTSHTRPRPKDLWSVDLSMKNNLVWHRIEVHGADTRQRVGAAMVHFGSSRLLVFGGSCDGAKTDDMLVIESIFSPKPICRTMPKFSGYPWQLESKYTYFRAAPSPRECPRVLSASNKLYVLGGTAVDKGRYYELRPKPMSDTL